MVFSTTTREWLHKVIRQRKELLRLDRNRKPEAAARAALYKLDLYLSVYTYAHPVQMAKFIRNYGNDIELILPGVGSPAHEKYMREFEKIRRDSDMILNGKQKELELCNR